MTARDGSSKTQDECRQEVPPPISEFWDSPGCGVLKTDPHLRGWVGNLQLRQIKLQQALDNIQKLHGGFEPFTRLQNRGFVTSYDGSVTYTEYAPNAQAMSLVGDFNGFDTAMHPMTKVSSVSDLWTVTVNSDSIGEPIAVGSEVAVDVTPLATEILPEPKALRRIPAQILHATQTLGETTYRGRMALIPRVFPAAGFENSSGSGQRPARPAKRSTERIYEAHIGVAIGNESGIGTYSAFEHDVLPRVAAGGYTTLQLMGIAEHPYYPSFGYQVTNFFAPSSRFGTTSDLISLIDKSHSLGIRVILDLVHGHASSNEGEGLNRFDGSETAGYFRYQWHPEWKTRLFDYSRPEVIRFLLCNLRFWVERIGFDGFRFDSVTSSLFLDHGLNRGFSGNYDEYFGDTVDSDAVTYFQLANLFLNEMFPGQITTIAEDVSGYPTLCRPVTEGGLGFDVRLALGHPDMWFKLLRENHDMAELPASALTDILSSLMGRRAHLGEKTIAYVECHDQCIGGHKTAAHWLFDTDIYDQMTTSALETERVRVGMRWHKLIRMLTHTLGGEGYLNFMGNEFGHPEWLDFPAAHNHYSHAHAHRKWHLGDDSSLRFNQLLAFDKALNEKEAAYGWLDCAPAQILLHDEKRRLIIYDRAGLLFAYNLSASDAFFDTIPAVHLGDYTNVLDTDEIWYGGKSETSRFGLEATASIRTNCKYLALKVWKYNSNSIDPTDMLFCHCVGHRKQSGMCTLRTLDQTRRAASRIQNDTNKARVGKLMNTGMAECPCEVGRRYLHAASGLPLTLRYVGRLAETSSTWLGVEWDDSARGKHSGSHKGEQIFTTRVPGAGSFIKFSPASSSSTPLLLQGPTFVDVINERYTQAECSVTTEEAETVVLGSSNGNIIVEAPRLDKVRKRLNQLDNLKEAALEGLWISDRGDGRLAGHLSSLTRLNMSQNLLVNWDEVARVCALLPALRALVLNESRLNPNVTGVVCTALSEIGQLHLGKTLTSWKELSDLSKHMLRLEILHLNGCSQLGSPGLLRGCLPNLRELNLESSAISDWPTIVNGLSLLPGLHTLDLSSTAFNTIQPPTDHCRPLPALYSLTILNTAITRWSDIDNLDLWTSRGLESLRIRLAAPTIGSEFMKGDLSDRPILIAKLSQLKSLNSTSITPAERTDSERFYVSFVSKILQEETMQHARDWGRYEELCQVHGDPAASRPSIAKKNILASKLILIHVHHTGRDSASIQVLPSSPLRLAKRKIAKALALPASAQLTCWTVQNADDVAAGEAVVPGLELEEESREIGWWLQDGDWVHVDV